MTFAPALVFLTVVNFTALPLNLEVVFAIFGQNGFLGQNFSHFQEMDGQGRDELRLICNDYLCSFE